MVIERIFDGLKSSGVKNIYLLTDKKIGFDINFTTEGLHPNDIGMVKYAIAYEKKIRKILSEPSGNISTEIPTEQHLNGYDWIKRHEDGIKNIEKTNPATLLNGNSITNYWGGNPKGSVARGQNEWDKHITPMKVRTPALAGIG